MKYRIVQTGEGFIIQHKEFGLFWVNHKLCNFSDSCVYRMCIGENKINIVYHSLEDAMSRLKEIKKYPIKFMGHKIFYGIQYGTPLYIDSHSYCGTDYEDRPCYKLYANNIEDLKEKIKLKIEGDNRHKEAILMKKKNKEIINVWYED